MERPPRWHIFSVETTTEQADNLKSSQSPAPTAASAQFPVELMVCQYCSPPLQLGVQTGNQTSSAISRGVYERAAPVWARTEYVALRPCFSHKKKKLMLSAFFRERNIVWSHLKLMVPKRCGTSNILAHYSALYSCNVYLVVSNVSSGRPIEFLSRICIPFYIFVRKKI